MENQDFPSFVNFNNDTRVISFKPMNNTKWQGNTYYFSVVLKQTHSDYIMNIYYITVKFTGSPYEAPEDTDDDDEDVATTPNNTFVPTS